MPSRSRVASVRAQLGGIRHVWLDLDGTIYKGGAVFSSTVPFLKLLKKLGIGYTFITNNSSKSTRDYLRHLRGLGIYATAEQLRTSTQATLEYLRKYCPGAQRVFVLGTRSLM